MSEPNDANADRREALIRRVCKIMGWSFLPFPVPCSEVIQISPAKLEEIAERLEEARFLIDQLDCLATPHYPALYERAQRWKGKTV